MTPKTIKKLNLGKKSDRQDKVTLVVIWSPSVISLKVMVIEKIAELKNSLQKYKAQESQDSPPSKAELKKTIQCLELLNE